MIAITCITNKNQKGYENALVPSCKYYDINLESIVYDGNWHSHRLKDFYVRRYLKKLAPGEIVLFTDGYDTIFLCGEQEIIEKYNSLDVPILFSSEINCYPHHGFSYLYKPSTSKFKYLNSGGFIGRVSDILDLYNQLDNLEITQNNNLDNSYKWSNQYQWTKLFLQKEGLISLDTNCKIFQTFGTDLIIYHKLQTSTSEVIKNRLIEEEINLMLQDFNITKRLRNIVTQSSPCHLHFISSLLKDFVFSDKLKPILPWLD